MLKGVGVSPGIVIGKALVFKKEDFIIQRITISCADEEKKRFHKAVDQAKQQIEFIKSKSNEEQRKILDGQIMILEDPELIKRIADTIGFQKLNAEAVLEDVIKMYISIFEGIGDEYMRERAADIRDVGRRLTMILLDKQIPDLTELNEPVIIIAHDITPSDTAQMDGNKVLGFITEIGGRTSHSAIMARSMEIPAAAGLSNITEQIKTGNLIVFDGTEGIVFINPEQVIIDRYRERKEKEIVEKQELMELVNSDTVSKDGRKVEIGCNIGSLKDAQKALKNGAEGIGLFRTEFLYMNRAGLPAENEQFKVYKEVLEIMGNRPVIIRTMDIGGDKGLAYMNLPKEANPFLGYRAIRICLDQEEIFKTQLRALLRASLYGNLKIMYPMISSLEELREANNVLKKAKKELEEEKIPYSPDIQAGIMIEVPAAAIISDQLAKEADFFSIGSNDLIQYTIAVDRMNDKIAALYNPFHPAVLRLIKLVIENGHKAGIWVGMCGEAAADQKLIPLLLGMGLDEFSMNAGDILPARRQIKSLSYEEMKKIAEQIIEMDTADNIKKFLDECRPHSCE